MPLRPGRSAIFEKGQCGADGTILGSFTIEGHISAERCTVVLAAENLSAFSIAAPWLISLGALAVLILAFSPRNGR